MTSHPFIIPPVLARLLAHKRRVALLGLVLVIGGAHLLAGTCHLCPVRQALSWLADQSAAALAGAMLAGLLGVR